MWGVSLDIKYCNKKIEKICTNATSAIKKYGQQMADLIHQRIDEIYASDSIEFMIKYGIGRCHPLHNNRKNQYAVDLVHPYRLVFTKLDNEVHVVSILEIVDYH